MAPRSDRTEKRIALARKLFEQLRATDLRALERDLIAALERDDMNATPDGFPTRQQGTTRPANPDEDVSLTSVEGAAAALIEGRAPKDEVHTQTRAAERHLVTAVDLLNSVRARLNLIPTAAGAPVHDEPCENHRRANLTVDGKRFGNVGGRLDRPWWLCDACYDFVRGGGRLPEMNRLPDEEELQHHSRSGRWKIREQVKP